MNDPFKRQLETALREPSAPEPLVERTIRRCQAVTRARLARAGDTLSGEERRELAADGPTEGILAGRPSCGRLLPMASGVLPPDRPTDKGRPRDEEVSPGAGGAVIK